jgi:hypothetical protein
VRGGYSFDWRRKTLASEKKEKHEVKDKRRVNPDGTLKENVEAEAPVTEAAEEQPTPEQAAEPQAEAAAEAPTQEAEQEAEAPHDHEHEEMPAPDVFQTLQFVTGLLAEQAWQFMGLHLPPGHKQPVTDMVQAKIAIDTIIFVSDKLHPHLGDEERRAIRGIVSDLQLNFVQRNR